MMRHVAAVAYGTRGSLFQFAGMIRMAVRDEDRRLSQIAKAAEPILATINEHPTPSGSTEASLSAVDVAAIESEYFHAY
jgi:hypothetical protein